ncbi:E3 ubiquitin-protein ligase TRIM71-like [Anneissia japonica]|uniref:E3 ubiquitin-protein ligase TRIM71-like n=1 Tax=Anneissia japonica TaxID=1529436 RepID=UPI001425B6B9|nr:E3 ubiquitin-protein ligase TRIM71-like [Anneissia japonica]XP_033106086.1 E3 ubiquitin-protein ligase TRIM71-like [Anneissia japonica]
MAEKDVQLSIVGGSNKCPICLETCQELKTLYCQHSFCLPCLQDWLKKKEKLECPNCHQIHPISDGGLQELPSNIIKVETAEHLNKDGDIKCCCGKFNAGVYCQDCCQYLCTSCKNCHEIFPLLKNHTLQPINANWLKDANVPEHQPLCPLHEQKLELYCNICKAPICQKCAVEHSEDEGQHEVTTASDAFNDFKVTGNMLMAQADIYKQQAQVGINKCITNASKLSKSRICLKKDINNTVEEIVESVRETGKELEAKLDDVCEAKKEKSNSQIDELKSVISDIEKKQEYITKLLKSDQATALQSCQQATKELQQMIAEVLLETEPRDDGKVFFTSSKDQILSALKQHRVGVVSEKPNEHIFAVSEYPKRVTQYQSFYVKVAQSFKCEIDKNNLNANWTSSCLHTDLTAKFEQPVAEGEYLVAGPTRLPIVSGSGASLTLNIQFCNAPIKGSPITIQVEPRRRTIRNLFNVIGVQSEGITYIFMSQNGYFLVVGETNIIYKLKNTGEYMSIITLLPNARVSGICQLKNNHLIVCDRINKNITFFRQDGQVVKSISTGQSSCPSGIDVNEELNLVYVADTNNCVEVFNMESYSKVKTIGCKGALEGQMNGPSSVAVTKDGNIIVADAHNPRIQLFDHEGQFINLLVGIGPNDNCIGKNPSRVIVDCDENIIVASECKVQLFDKLGRFIKVIYETCRDNWSPIRKKVCVSIASHYPRRLSVAELTSSEVHVISY